MKYSVRSLMRFSIRDLALLTVIVALIVAWCLDHLYLAEDARITREQKARARDYVEKERRGYYDKPDRVPPNSPAPARIQPKK